jgi:hypothetical protein
MLFSVIIHYHLTKLASKKILLQLKPEDNPDYTECPTRYRTRHFFNNSNANEDIATKFERGTFVA